MGWSGLTPDFDSGVFLQRFTADGQPLGETFQANEIEYQSEYGPAMIRTAEGGLMLFWTAQVRDWDSGASWDAAYDIILRSFDDDFNPLTIEVESPCS